MASRLRGTLHIATESIPHNSTLFPATRNKLYGRLRQKYTERKDSFQSAKHQECLGKIRASFTCQAAWRTSCFPSGNSCYRPDKRTVKDMSTVFFRYDFTMYAVFMKDGLSQQEIKLLKGNEPFRGQGVRKSLQLLDYWRWSGSELLGNTTRGILAEFLVASALGLHKRPRAEWGGYDLRMESGTTIEVKSSAYVQSWKQKKYFPINFTIAPRFWSWDPETGESIGGDVKQRWADIYVFCVFTKKEPPFNPLDTAAWDFYVLSTKVLDQELSEQKTIRLSSLEKLSPRKCSYADLKGAISDLECEIKQGS